MEKLRYLYLNVDELGGPYVGSNKTANAAFARLKLKEHSDIKQWEYMHLYPDLDDVNVSFMAQF